MSNPALIKVKAILFDVGGTLINVRPKMRQALYKTADYLESENLISNKFEFIKAYELVDKEINGPKINHLYSDPLIITETAIRLNIYPSLYFIGAFLNVYRNYIRKSIKKNQGLIRLFRTLKMEGFKIGIVTDGSTIEQIEQLYKLGILKYIDAMITSEELNIEKPNAIIFRKILRYLSIKSPSDAVMIGDDLERDIVGAKAIGIKTIWITNYLDPKSIKRGNRVTPDIVINSINEVTKYIRYAGDIKDDI